MAQQTKNNSAMLLTNLVVGITIYLQVRPISRIKIVSRIKKRELLIDTVP